MNHQDDRPHHGSEHNGADKLLDRLTENVWARFARSVVLPLITLLLIPLVGLQWQGMRNDLRDVKAVQALQAAKQTQTDQRVAIIDTKLDAGLIWRLTQLEQRFDGLQARMDARAAETHP